MGQVLGKSKDEANLYEPQVLKGLENIDLKRLKKLIRKKHLAPCYPGVQEPDSDQGDLEECPICFLHFPALNTSECCSQRICTECILKVQVAAIDPWPCPFCKKPDYTVKFTGPKTKEEKEKEMLEHQRVLEARARERQDEIIRDQQRELERLQVRQAGASTGTEGPTTTAVTTAVNPTPAVAPSMDAPAEASGTGLVQSFSERPSLPTESLRSPYTLEAFLPATLSNMVDNVEQLNDYMLELALCNSALEASSSAARSEAPQKAAAGAQHTESSLMQGQLAALPSSSGIASVASSSHKHSQPQQHSHPTAGILHEASMPTTQAHCRPQAHTDSLSEAVCEASTSFLQTDQQTDPSAASPLASAECFARGSSPRTGSVSTTAHSTLSSPACASGRSAPVSTATVAEGSDTLSVRSMHQLLAQAAAMGDPPGLEKIRVVGMVLVSPTSTTQSTEHSTACHRPTGTQGQSATAPSAAASTSVASQPVEGADDQAETQDAPLLSTPSVPSLTPQPTTPVSRGKLVGTVLDDPQAPAWRIHPIVIENPDASFYVNVPTHPMGQWESFVSAYSSNADARLMAAIAGGDQDLLQRVGAGQAPPPATGLGTGGAGDVGMATGEGVHRESLTGAADVPGSSQPYGSNVAECDAQGGAGAAPPVSNECVAQSQQSAAADEELDFVERLRRADAAYAAAIARGDQQFTTCAYPSSQ